MTTQTKKTALITGIARQEGMRYSVLLLKSYLQSSGGMRIVAMQDISLTSC